MSAYKMLYQDLSDVMKQEIEKMVAGYSENVRCRIKYVTRIYPPYHLRKEGCAYYSVAYAVIVRYVEYVEQMPIAKFVTYPNFTSCIEINEDRFVGRGM